MIPKNQKTATSTKQARITSKHELTSVQSSCIPTNQQPAPTSTNQQPAATSTKQARITSKHQAAITYQGHEPTSNQHQAARTSRHVLPAGHEPTNDKKYNLLKININPNLGLY